MADSYTQTLMERFEEADAEREGRLRRVALELKFPVVMRATAEAAPREIVQALWRHLEEHGWQPMVDPYSEQIIGAKRGGAGGIDVLSSATGYCVIELSIAPEASLDGVRRRVGECLEPVLAFCREHELVLLGHGIHPVTAPAPELLTAKARNAFWDDVFEERGQSARVHLFTTTAASQAHVDIRSDEAADALVVFNGLAPAQIALNANSGVWNGDVDGDYKCVHESFWDRWLPGKDRVGMPTEKPSSLTEYVEHLMALRPVYVEREGEPVRLPSCESFAEFCESERSPGRKADGELVEVAPTQEDLELHLTFCWHNARLSRYWTLENRVNCQQPPDSLLAVGALSLGLAEHLPQARELVDGYDWDDLRAARVDAMRRGLYAKVGEEPMSALCEAMLEVASDGLRTRGEREQSYLAPLWRRLTRGQCPADAAARRLQRDGMGGLVERLAVR
jgi:gamma-glutamylcysteine synthetase